MSADSAEGQTWGDVINLHVNESKFDAEFPRVSSGHHRLIPGRESDAVYA